MRGLRQQVADYLHLRRAIGFGLREHERLLNQFLDYLELVGATTLTTEDAVIWARSPKGASVAWHAARLSVIRGFAEWARAFDPAIQVPPPGVLPLRTTRATPFLYSFDDVTALLHAAGDLAPTKRAATYQTLVGLLWVTGIRIGEAIGADVADLDLAGGGLDRGARQVRQAPSPPAPPKHRRSPVGLSGDAAGSSGCRSVTAAGVPSRRPPALQHDPPHLQHTRIPHPIGGFRLSNGKTEIKDIIEDGDKVCIRWRFTGTHTGSFMGTPASGNNVSMQGIEIHRIDDGKIAEGWTTVDLVALMMQIGAIPPPD